MNNLYWNVYRSLERELLDIADTIHIDDKQLSTYSTRIANLLVRTVIEIESISKELYIREGGAQSEQGNHLYFDTDCLALLESKWTLSKKVVMISSPILYTIDPSNQRFTPLHKASKRGDSGSDWKKAYQAVKHDRSGSLSQGNIKHFIRALGALFLLNLYYQDQGFDLGMDVKAKSFDVSLGSSLFSIELHPFLRDLHGDCTKTENYEQCTYIICSTQKSKKLFQEALAEADKIAADRASSSLQQDIESLSPSLTTDERSKKKKELEDRYRIDYTKQYLMPALLEEGGQFRQAVMDIKYEALLNKNQY